MKPTPSLFIRLLTGIVLAAITTGLYLFSKTSIPLNSKVINSNLISLLAYTLAAISINKLLYFPGKQSWLHILPAVGLSYSSVFGMSAVFFVTFSNSFVITNGILATAFFVGDFIRRNRHIPHIAYIPIGRASQAQQIPHVKLDRTATTHFATKQPAIRCYRFTQPQFNPRMAKIFSSLHPARHTRVQHSPNPRIAHRARANSTYV